MTALCLGYVLTTYVRMTKFQGEVYFLPVAGLETGKETERCRWHEHAMLSLVLLPAISATF